MCVLRGKVGSWDSSGARSAGGHGQGGRLQPYRTSTATCAATQRAATCSCTWPCRAAYRHNPSVPLQAISRHQLQQRRLCTHADSTGKVQ